MSETSTDSQIQKLPARAYLVGALTQFGLGMHQPFLQTYMIDMGASFVELGTFRSVGNIAPTVLQPAWGASSDKLGHTKAFVAFGTFSGFLTVFMFLWAATPLDMIILYGIQSILYSMQIPTWVSLIGGLMDETNRGDELGRLGMVTNIASLLATLTGGFIAGFPALIPYLRSAFGDLGQLLIPSVEVWREAYYLPFYLTAIIGIVSSILSLTIVEKYKVSQKVRRFPPILKLLSKPGDFRRLCFVAVFFSFAMSMAWPYFAIVQRIWLGNTLLEIAITSAIMTLMTVAFMIPFGKLSDRVGRKPLIVFGRSILFVVPLLYAFATNIQVIYVANAIAGITIAATMNANTAYIYDVAPPEEIGAHLAVFNTFTGIVFLFGSFLSGLIGEILLPIFGDYGAVFIMLLVSSALRFIASFFYLLLREPREYTSTLWIEFRAIFGRIIGAR